MPCPSAANSTPFSSRVTRWRPGIPLLFRFTHPQAGEGFGVGYSMHTATYADLAVRGDWVALEPVIRWRDHLFKPVMHAAYGRAANR
jgi:hypothetical protein